MCDDFHVSFVVSYMEFLGSFLAILMIIGVVNPSFAQKTWGDKRALRVEVAEIKTRVLSDFADVQGRVIEGPSVFGYGHY